MKQAVLKQIQGTTFAAKANTNHLEYILYGNEIKKNDVEHAIELSRTKYRSVSAMLSASAKITHSYRIETSP